ncbi:MAG: hypothetical protein ACRDMH_00730 [Solirubrobacterales bacterium]
MAVRQLALGLAVLLTPLLAPAPAQASRPGDLDPSFSRSGKVRTDFAGPHDGANAVALDPHGRVVAAGHTCNADYRECDFAVARYRPGGRLDAAPTARKPAREASFWPLGRVRDSSSEAPWYQPWWRLAGLQPSHLSVDDLSGGLLHAAPE